MRVLAIGEFDLDRLSKFGHVWHEMRQAKDRGDLAERDRLTREVEALYQPGQFGLVSCWHCGQAARDRSQIRHAKDCPVAVRALFKRGTP